MGELWDQPVSELPGIGPERTGHLGRLGLVTIHDLLLHRPRRYEDRSRVAAIRDLKPGEAATVKGRVLASGVRRGGQPGRTLCDVIMEDETGRMTCRWWNLPYMRNQFKVGDVVFVYGKTGLGEDARMDHPETETVVEGEEPGIHLNRLAPIYPLTEGISQRWLRSILWRLAHEWRERATEPLPGLPELGFLTVGEAIHRLHVPGSLDQAEQARQRLAMDEFVELQRTMLGRRRRMEKNAPAMECGGTNELIHPFLKNLGFDLTGAQTAVLREIRGDLSGRRPMRRLVQGDVGCGKTVVAACAILMALESGKNALLMAPTEILAEQHFSKFSEWFTSLGLEVRLMTGNRKTPPPEAASSAPRLVIGTHALLEETFEIENLGLVVIDEQHKFGVTQREALVRKGRYPHVLVMTATPIPRSLGLTLYGDLDLSVLAQAPPGRGQIRTYARGEDKMPRILGFIRGQLDAGRQAFVVYPRIDDSELEGSRTVSAARMDLEKSLTPWRIGLLHGRMKAAEKYEAMREFRENRTQVLVATPVIEVGVDVPNATVMVVMDAERFGLAQLHQIRGRIGRGPHHSFCILVHRFMKTFTHQAARKSKFFQRCTTGAALISAMP